MKTYKLNELPFSKSTAFKYEKEGKLKITRPGGIKGGITFVTQADLERCLGTRKSVSDFLSDLDYEEIREAYDILKKRFDVREHHLNIAHKAKFFDNLRTFIFKEQASMEIKSLAVLVINAIESELKNQE